jgi:site-specific DNA-cytosine methylase
MNMQMDLFQNSQSLLPDIRANRSPKLANSGRNRTLATSGRGLLNLLHKRDPLFAFLKTCMVTLPWDSTTSSLTWKAKATPRQRLLYQLAVSEPSTKETGSGSAPEKSSDKTWPTPVADDTGMRKKKYAQGGTPLSLAVSTEEKRIWPTPLAQEAKHGAVTEWELTTDHCGTAGSLRVAVAREEIWPTPTAQDGGKATKRWREDHQNNLTAAVFNPEKLWPTPTAMTGGENPAPSHFKKGEGRHGWNLGAAVKSGLWPTPAAVNHKGSPKNRFMGSPTYRGNLDEAVRTHHDDLHLNPSWVEWLMGYPPGWVSAGGKCEIEPAEIGTPWKPDPGNRVCESFPGRANQLKALGNAIVPQIAQMLGTAIVEELDRA